MGQWNHTLQMLHTQHFFKACNQGSAFGLGSEIEQIPVVPWTTFVEAIVQILVPVVLKYYG
ncbi:hypothetical protein D3C80_2154130 [compost metagenome]